MSSPAPTTKIRAVSTGSGASPTLIGSSGYARVQSGTPDWRITLLVMAICCAIYVPLLGTYGMFDPWETHYTEVARQFMERDDWLSPYWHNGTGPEGWAETHFWSKPVGSFWLSGLTLKLLGFEDKITLRGTGRSLSDPAKDPPSEQAGPDPGKYLATSHVEWAVRLPFFLCGLFGIFCVYLMCTRLFGRRTGVLAALILATSPMYFMIARQAMTDMPYVGLMTGGLALFMMAVFGQQEKLPRKTVAIRRRLLRARAETTHPSGRRSIPAGGVAAPRNTRNIPSPPSLASGAPQHPDDRLISARTLSWPHAPSYYLFLAVYLISLGLIFAAIVPPLLRIALPVKVVGQPISVAIWLLIYAVGAVVFLWLSRNTRTKNEVYLYGFYFAVAIAGLAKGFIGTLQPGFLILLYLVVTWEWRMLAEVALGRGLLVAATIFAPWWHAMVLRHGAPFWNELIGTEQVRRLTVGEQAQAKGSWEYYIRQLGYAFFPWIAFLPAALVRGFGIGKERSARDRALLFCFVWFGGAMMLFTLTATKYNHYILPAIPPAAIIVAIYLDELLQRRIRQALVGLLAALCVLGVVAFDLVKKTANWVWMYTYLYTSNWERGAPDPLPIEVYALACVVVLLLIAIPVIRKYAIWGFVAVVIAVGGYVMNWHQSSCAPHWGQKRVIASYYRLRKSPKEQLIAWQFNWRGETWYTAAQVVVAKSLDNKAIQDWLKKRPHRKFFFITERSRYASLRNMLPTAKGRQTLRIVDDSNVHFVLAEAQL